jgi:DNA-binding NtrC family response regulator
MSNKDTKCPILLVEDNEDLCKILVTVLTRICPVHVEHTLACARLYLSSLEENPSFPTIILLDNNLPDGNGFDYLASLHHSYPAIKLVLMTADSSEGLKEKAISEGATYFIAKPFQTAAMRHFILSVCPELRVA